MEKEWQYRTPSPYLYSGGYPNEPTGVIPNDTSWKTPSSSTVDVPNIQYYYRDSNGYSASDPYANSSQVILTIDQDINVSVSSNNTLTAVVTGKILSIVRNDIRGNPNAGGNTTKRNIYIRQSPNGPNIATFTGLDISVAGTIAQNITLPSFTITLAPGGGNSQYSLYVLNCLPGHENDPLPSINVDAIYMGIEVRNPLPADYRPGMTWNGSNWMSHNRASGACNIWTGSSWQEMRTVDYPTGSGDPPEMYRDGAFFNQAKIGQE